MSIDKHVRDHLTAVLTNSRADLQHKLSDLKMALERVKGLQFWIHQNASLIEWCENLLSEIEDSNASDTPACYSDKENDDEQCI